MTRRLLVAGCLNVFSAAAFAQQPPAAGAPLDLGVLHREAQAADARAREVGDLERQSTLRQRNVDVERLPALSVLGQTQAQSDVPTAPFTLPSGDPLFSPPKVTWDASLRVDQRLFDPSRGPRRALEDASLAESQARVRTSIFGVRAEVNDAFFTAALLQEQSGAVAAAIEDLEARLRDANARVGAGAAVQSDADAVEAALVAERQRADELRATRSAALARLSRLTARPISADAALTLPDLAAAVATARRDLDAVRARPEYAQFARTRERVARQEDLAAAADRPQLSAFGRVGYGRPGLNFIQSGGETYALAGVQLQWKAWSWNASTRDREALAIQRDIVAAEETAFANAVALAIENDLATIDRLQRVGGDDDRLVELRAAIERTAGVRLSEGAATASDYVDRRTDRLHAQFTRARHKVELAYAQARLLTTLGLEVR